jgi:hypothetical protein
MAALKVPKAREAQAIRFLHLVTSKTIPWNGYVTVLSTGQKMSRNPLCDIKRSE